MTPQQKLLSLQLQKAQLLDKISRYQSPFEKLYLQLGKITYQIHQTQKEIIRQTQNITDEAN